MFILKVFTDDGILMLLDAQVEVAARVAYIIRYSYTFIYLIFIHNALLVTSEGFDSVTFKFLNLLKTMSAL